MATTLNTVGRANLRASKGKYILTGIGIAISSFFIAAVIVLVSSLQGTLNASVNGILSKADNVVVSSYARDNSNTEANIYLDEESIKNIQNDDSVDQSWIVYQGRGKFGPDKTQVSYTQAPNSADLFPFDFEGKLPTSDTELMVSKDFAQKHNLQLNSKVSSPDIVASISDPNTGTTREYTITGIFDVGFSGSDTNNAMFIGGTSYGEAANKALKNAGGASSANYAVPGASMAYVKFKGTDDAAARAELQKKLNTGDKKTEPSVMSGPEYMEVVKKQLSTMFTFLGVILGAFAALALLVSSFVISNTFAVLVGQRVRELALLRTLGARGGSLVRMLLIESLIIGVFFSVIGSGLVYAVGGILNAMFSSFIVNFSPTAFIAGVLMCTAVTVLASLIPARTALSISPISAMSASTSQAVKKPSVLGGIFGILSALAGVIIAIAAIGNKDGGSAISSVLLACLFLGIAVFLLTPWVLIPLVRFFGVALRGQTGKLALANSLRSPKRTVSTGRAVLVGTLVISAVLTSHSVMSASIAQEIDRISPISAYAPFGESTATNGSASVTKAHEVADKIRGTKNVEAVSVGSAAGIIEYTAKPDNADSANLKDNVIALSNDDLHKVATGESGTNVKNDEVLVPQDIWDLGKFDNSTRLKVSGPLGEIELKPVKANTKEPFFVVSPETGAQVQNASDPQAASNQALPDDPAAQEALMKAAQENPALARSFAARGTATMVLVRASTPLSSSDNTELQGELAKANNGTDFQGGLQIRKNNDQMLTIMLSGALILLALAIVIAIIGVANTMTLSVNERRRENAMLRSLGLSRKQLRRMVSTEAVMITLGALAMGIVSGVGIGLVLSQVLVHATRESMAMAVVLPVSGLVLVLIVGIIAAFAASAIPAFRSARQSPVEGLSSH